MTAPSGEAASSKNWLATVLLSFFLGVHRFYTGKTGTGILMLITFGGLGLWALIDFIVILAGAYEDSDALPVKNG
ncbi:TM2 domain-containing protein [Nocardiopsis sp. CNT312]|uniref:TM2 domain-containing protein n=1 Tax=Nocardiopsis sp. CNT312 TaxID=1137268 RepID=UPI00048D99BC|nr:TM2 domain-containing protein [Nocardiopsis sp. CNT312]